jgi:diguanylate cyclase (GGDEF)-like protein
MAGALATLTLLALYLQTRARWRQARDALSTTAQQLRDTRSHDPLTGLFNRSGFERELQPILQRCAAQNDKFCVLYLDVDQFQTINDAFGHPVGDQVLTEMARRITAHGDKGQPSARITANGFATVVTGDPSFGDAFARELGQAMAQTFGTASGSVHLSCSIGIAAFPAQASGTDILDKAAAAMRIVKDRGGAGHAHYDAALDHVNRDNARILQDLRGAVDRRELFLHYQPKVDATSLQITAAEVLMRWRHPRLGVLGPDKFIPLAERHGLIRPIGRWAIEQACKQAALWRAQELRMRIAVNISADQLQQADFVDHLEETLGKSGIPPARFTCEITESVAMQDTDHTHATFDRLRQLGVHVSIDDFGTGHSSLASLKRLPAAELKIDKAFVNDLVTSAHAQYIARTIVMMAHELHMRVVAEGVENGEQRDLLVEMGCDELQGYLFGKPMAGKELAQWSARDRQHDEELFRPSLYSATRHQPLQ